MLRHNQIPDAISLGCNSSKCLLDRESLNSLQEVLVKVFPEWTRKLFVVEDEEEMEEGVELNARKPNHLHSLLAEAAEKCRPFRRRIYDNYLEQLRDSNSAHIPRPYDRESWSDECTITDNVQDIMLFLDYSTRPCTLEGNSISIHGYALKSEGITTSVLMKSALLELVDGIHFDWGFVRTDGEFEDKNRDERGHVVGVDLSQGLPGLYWLNYFGPWYCEAIGRDRLLSTPAAWIKETTNGVVVALGYSPNDWNATDYRARCRAAEQHLGKKWFFNKDDPNRKLVTPRFAFN
jgi:hypothetical protein